jgi:quinoprotein glucose dehydrogenase
VRRTIFLLALSALAASRSVWDGVYTKDQAARGLTAYQEECMKCHGENGTGGEAAPALAGAEWLAKWKGKSVGDLYTRIRKTMPTDDPGNLSTRQYSDIVAYLLSLNEFPAGSKELDRDTTVMNEIRLEAKP